MPPARESSASRRRRVSALPLADLVSGCLSPALAKQGFSAADVLIHWPEIVGETLAERCRPVRLQWRRPEHTGGADAPATLVVRVEGAFAPVLQHSAPVVLERLNVYFGWRCVEKLALRQGPVPALRARRPDGKGIEANLRRLPPEATEGVADEQLRAALDRLGTRVLTAGRRHRSSTMSQDVSGDVSAADFG